MLDLSKPLTAVHLRDYFKNEYSLASNSYFSEDGKVKGYWAGKLAPELGLRGWVSEEEFARLADGRHPVTKQQLIEHRKNTVPTHEWVKNNTAWHEHLESKYVDASAQGSKLFAPARAYKTEKPEKISKETPAPEYTERQKLLLEMHEVAVKLFERNLASHSAAQAYLAGRQIRPELSSEFGLGVAGSKGNELVDALKHYGPELMKESGLFVETESGELRDRFRGRLMFPIQDAAGNVVAFAGRKLRDDEFGPKYLNSPATDLYSKSATLYNLHRVKDAARIVTVEGYTDVIAAHAAGVKAVAACGTAFTAAHAKMLAGRAVTINTDADEAGQKAARRQVEALLSQGVVPSVATLKRKDAAEVLEKDGAKAYRKQIHSAAPVVEWLSATIREKHPGNDPFDSYARVDAIREIMSVLEQTAPERRAEIERQLSHQLAVDPAPEPSTEQKPHLEHRAGWDFTFKAPKSISVSAIVGGDELVREAHRRAVNKTLEYGESWVQARMGGNHWPQTTRKWVVAAFEHDTARPVNGYPAPQLHTHCIVFNITVDENGRARSLQTQEFYKIQEMLTWVYRSEFAHELRRLGYELERGAGGAPEIAGYSKEYLEDESQRARVIRERLEELGLSGARGGNRGSSRPRGKAEIDSGRAADTPPGARRRIWQ
jgi:DNA primase catalytic core